MPYPGCHALADGIHHLGACLLGGPDLRLGLVESQLELLLRRIEELREGAFSPFSQQPVVRAMLLPLGSLGGTALLGYLLGPGFG